ncbi:hypothetical protein HDU98_004943 [Podochytrium sp. JEL0797]|nr:hypothetical protein HDU98_004943 [Podochytrium sp. JEL0797]
MDYLPMDLLAHILAPDDECDAMCQALLNARGGASEGEQWAVKVKLTSQLWNHVRPQMQLARFCYGIIMSRAAGLGLHITKIVLPQRYNTTAIFRVGYGADGEKTAKDMAVRVTGIVPEGPRKLDFGDGMEASLQWLKPDASTGLTSLVRGISVRRAATRSQIPIPLPTQLPVPLPTQQPAPLPTQQPVPLPTQQPVPLPTHQTQPPTTAPPPPPTIAPAAGPPPPPPTTTPAAGPPPSSPSASPEMRKRRRAFGPESNETLHLATKEIYDALSSTPISALLAHKRSRRPDNSLHLIAVEHHTPLRDVLKVLNENSILAVAVFVEDEEGKKYTGIVSIYDVLAWTVFQKMFDDLEKLDTPSNDTPSNQGPTAKGFTDLNDQAEAYFSTPVKQLIGYTAESSMSWTLHSTEPVSSLLQMITTTPYHRLLVDDLDQSTKVIEVGDKNAADKDGCIVMITQSDLLDFLFTSRVTISPNAMTHLLSSSIQSAQHYSKAYLPRSTHRNPDLDLNQPTTMTPHKPNIITVPSTFTALAAFRVMYIHRVSAIAITDPVSGEMVANLSASDLRGITADMASLESFLLPVFSFLEARGRGPESVQADQVRDVNGRQSVENAVNLMLRDHIHRVWVVEEGDGDKPVGVMTMGDMLNLFVPVKEN